MNDSLTPEARAKATEILRECARQRPDFVVWPEELETLIAATLKEAEDERNELNQNRQLTWHKYYALKVEAAALRQRVKDLEDAQEIRAKAIRELQQEKVEAEGLRQEAESWKRDRDLACQAVKVLEQQLAALERGKGENKKNNA